MAGYGWTANVCEAQRPTSREEVDAYLRPIIAGVVELDAPADDAWRSLLTAEK